MNTNTNPMEYILSTISDDYTLRLLAEECLELGHAALKMVRVMNGETPVAPEAAIENLIEEMADVELMHTISMVRLLTPSERAQVCTTIASKTERFYDRLTEGVQNA